MYGCKTKFEYILATLFILFNTYLPPASQIIAWFGIKTSVVSI